VLEESEEFTETYAKRAAVEGTISQGTRRSGPRRSRYIVLQKKHLQHILTAAALNFVRVATWLADTPREKTRCSRFKTLMAFAPPA
jgi:transposase